jgi:LmbE family N-acetylglucosaminyl deacetylase
MEAELANETDTPGETPTDVPDPTETEEFGSPEALITHRIDVIEHVESKRRAMAAHASQIPPDSWVLQLSAEEFAAGFGSEWYIATGEARAVDEPFRTSIWD